jgi:hypothetical protein
MALCKALVALSDGACGLHNKLLNISCILVVACCGATPCNTRVHNSHIHLSCNCCCGPSRGLYLGRHQKLKTPNKNKGVKGFPRHQASFGAALDAAF